MSTLKLLLMFFCFSLSVQIQAEEKEEIPKDNKWEKTNDRDDNSPKLYQSESFA